MDSSRSGLLSTILMTLPLIVVPAVALLRPPGQAGVSTVSLEASEEESGLHDSFFDDLSGFDNDTSGAFRSEQSERTSVNPDPHQLDHDGHEAASKLETDIFDDLKTSAREVRRDSSERTTPTRGAPIDPFMDVPVPRNRVPEPEVAVEKIPPSKTPDDMKPALAGLSPADVVAQLNALGALKTIWFEAGEKTPVGLAVFYRGSKENTRIRFESVGQSRDACAIDVLGQVTRWQKQNPEH